MLYSQCIPLEFSSNVRSLSLWRDASAVTASTSFGKVNDGCVCRDAVLQGEQCQLPAMEVDERRSYIPGDDGARTVPQPDLEVGAALDVQVEEVEDSVRFLLLEADNSPGELAVDEQRLFTRDRVHAHDRVDVLDRLALDDAAAVALPRVLGLLNARMDRLKRLKVGAEVGGKVVVGAPAGSAVSKRKKG